MGDVLGAICTVVLKALTAIQAACDALLNGGAP